MKYLFSAMSYFRLRHPREGGDPSSYAKATEDKGLLAHRSLGEGGDSRLRGNDDLLGELNPLNRYKI